MNPVFVRLNRLPLPVLGVGLLATGCATMEVTKLPTRNADTYAQHAEKDGVTVAVRPLTDEREIKDMFKVDLRAKGLLPILLVAENHSAASSFILAKDKVSVLDETTGLASSSRQTKVASDTGGAVTATVGAAAISLPLVVAGLKLASDATVIQHNLADKELYSRTLGPGQKAQGFIYFQYPRGTTPSGARTTLSSNS